MSAKHKAANPSPGSSREWLARLGLVLFGVLLALVLLEGMLRIGAMFVESRPITLSEGRGTILALGDSHTYGVKTPPEESYPGHLQRLLDERAPGRYNVINLGVPGSNSARIAANLPEWIARYRPFAVIVSVGVNNRWNYSDTDESKRLGPVIRWLGDLRIMRLYHLLSLNLRSALSPPVSADRPELVRKQFDGDDARIEFRDAETGEVVATHEGKPDELSYNKPALRRLHQDLERMLEITAQRNVQLVLLTYSAFPLPGRPGWGINETMSEELRKFSAAHNLPLVDPRDRFFELLAGGEPRETYFLSALDDHPNGAGYAEIAALVADAFEPRPPP